MNRAEYIIIQRLQDDGWGVVSHGWPDLLCIRGDQVKAVEVKCHDLLRKSQLQNHAILRKAGILVEVVQVSLEELNPHFTPITLREYRTQRWAARKNRALESKQ